MNRLLLLVPLFLGAVPAAAQGDLPLDTVPRILRSDAQGLVLGVRVLGASIRLLEDEDGEAERGPGLGVRLGYGLGDRLGLFLRAEGARVDYASLSTDESYVVGHFEAGARWRFGSPAGAFRPFVEGAVALVSVTDELAGAEYQLSGGGLTLSGGVEYHLSRRLAVDLSLAATRGVLTSGEFGGEPIEPEEDFLTWRAGAGVLWRPFGGTERSP